MSVVLLWRWKQGFTWGLPFCTDKEEPARGLLIPAGLHFESPPDMQNLRWLQVWLCQEALKHGTGIWLQVLLCFTCMSQCNQLTQCDAFTRETLRSRLVHACSFHTLMSILDPGIPPPELPKPELQDWHETCSAWVAREIRRPHAACVDVRCPPALVLLLPPSGQVLAKPSMELSA